MRSEPAAPAAFDQGLSSNHAAVVHSSLTIEAGPDSLAAAACRMCLVLPLILFRSEMVERIAHSINHYVVKLAGPESKNIAVSSSPSICTFSSPSGFAGSLLLTLAECHACVCSGAQQPVLQARNLGRHVHRSAFNPTKGFANPLSMVVSDQICTCS